MAASVVFFYSFLENDYGSECDCSGRPLPHVLNSRFVSEKAPFRVYKSTDDRDWPICNSISDAESTGFGPRKPRCSVPVFPIEHS